MNNSLAASVFIMRVKLYIKLKIWCDAAGDAGVVMSFHKEGQYD